MRDDAGLRRLACWLVTVGLVLIPLVPDSFDSGRSPLVLGGIYCLFVAAVMLLRWVPSLFCWEIRLVYIPFKLLLAIFAGYMLVRAGVSRAFPFSLAELVLGAAPLLLFLVTLDCLDRRKQAEKVLNAVLLGMSIRTVVRLAFILFGFKALWNPLPGTAAMLLVTVSCLGKSVFWYPLAAEVILSGRWPLALISGILIWETRRRRQKDKSPITHSASRTKLIKTAVVILLFIGVTALVGRMGVEASPVDRLPAPGTTLPVHLCRGVIRAVVSSSVWGGVGQGALPTVYPLYRANYLSRPRLEGWKSSGDPSLAVLPWYLVFTAEHGVFGLVVIFILIGAFFHAAWQQYRYTYDPMFRELQLSCLAGVLAGWALAVVTGDQFRFPGLAFMAVLAATNLGFGKIDLFTAVGKVVFTIERPFKRLRTALIVLVALVLVLVWTVTVLRCLSASSAVSEAERLLGENKTKQAVELLESARGTFPFLRRLPVLLGEGYLKDGRLDEADKIIQEALAIYPVSRTYLAAARVSLGTGQPARARNYLESAGFRGADDRVLKPLLEELKKVALEKAAEEKKL